ncbi:EamA family transporter RarD [Streptomyces sp. MP131-18]|uniref:EamA family transporter RarD n=1 Tax=Streptomyces sp. MP131-18 TaxID=1857892 RepID=UPI00097C7F64|nr:EamA family transporter RarD [Streptomyces sp. MP131-18]ONK12195.1 putative chloramphenical resistance permease RarD [Streptomyces sp. MP131-18]
MAAGRGPAGRSGLAYGLAAFGLWGLLPLYWDLLASTGASEVLAHRMVWSLPTAVLLLLLARSWSWIRPLLRNPAQLALLVVSATLISLNWYLFIWAVAEDRVLEASLGYFINPLLTIAMGVVLLGERLRRIQWIAVGIGACAVVVMSVAYGQIPWISLALSVSFALYGLTKKKTGLDGLQGFTADSALQFLPALGFLVVLGARGEGTFTTEGSGHALLLVGSGIATALPLIFFGAATVRAPLSTIGLLQYIAPTTMFLLGLLVFGEEMPPERWAGFLLVWTALCLLTWDALRNARRGRRTVARHTPAAPAEHGPRPALTTD